MNSETKTYRRPREIISRMVVLAMLSAIGFVLMSFAQFPYPAAPWLKIEVSEITTLIGYALYGLPGGIIVAFIKTGLDISVHGLVGLGIGNITALLASLIFILGLFLTSRVFRWFSKGLLWRIISYVFISVLLAIVLTGLNALFITPSYLTVYGETPHFQTCFDEGVIQDVVNYLTHSEDTSVNGWIYIGVISGLYIPFNLMKGAIVCIAYEIVFNRLIFVLARRSPLMRKYFIGNILKKGTTKDDLDFEEDEESSLDDDID
jgi:riboflavin transporter FmnP